MRIEMTNADRLNQFYYGSMEFMNKSFQVEAIKRLHKLDNFIVMLAEPKSFWKGIEQVTKLIGYLFTWMI